VETDGLSFVNVVSGTPVLLAIALSVSPGLTT
jgi:hypothetical protein